MTATSPAAHRHDALRTSFPCLVSSPTSTAGTAGSGSTLASVGEVSISGGILRCCGMSPDDGQHEFQIESGVAEGRCSMPCRFILFAIAVAVIARFLQPQRGIPQHRWISRIDM